MKRRFFLWFLPLTFAICSVISFQYPGDEYALWGYSSIAGTWIWFVFQAGDMHNPMIPALAAGTGALVMAIPGLLLTKLKTNIRLWLWVFVICSVAIFIFTITRYPTIEKALSKNGSWQAYIFSSINVGLYLSIVPTVLIDIIIKFAKVRKNAKSGNTR